MKEAYWAFNYVCKHYQMIQERVPAAQKTGLGVLLSGSPFPIGQRQKRKSCFLAGAHLQAQVGSRQICPQTAIG
jgi:hypothetical protein